MSTPNFALARNERIYLVKQPTAGTIPHTGGTATLLGSNCCRHIIANLNNEVQTSRRRDKTGSRTATKGSAGRRNAGGTIEMSLAGNGTAGVLPDSDPLWESLFGKAATVNASTSVVYTFDDLFKYLCVYKFRTPATLSQSALHTSLVRRATIRLGQDIAEVTFELVSKWMLESSHFTGADASQKAGLTSFPTEPATPVTNGDAVIGFLGSVNLGGTVISDLVESIEIVIENANELVFGYGQYYPTVAEGDERVVTANITFSDSDLAGLDALKEKAIKKDPIDIDIVAGATAGNRFNFALKQVQLPGTRYNEPGRRIMTEWQGARAYGTSLTAKDELTLTIN